MKRITQTKKRTNWTTSQIKTVVNNSYNQKDNKDFIEKEIKILAKR